MNEPSQSEEKKEEEGPKPELPAVSDAVSVDLSAIEGLPLAEQRRTWTMSLLTATAAHALLLAIFLRGAIIGQVGAGGTELEAVHVDIVTTAVLESRSASAVSSTAAAPRPVEDTAGATEVSKEAMDAADQKQATAAPVERPAGPMPDIVIPDPVEEKPPPEPSDVVLTIAEERPEVPDEERPETEREQVLETAPESATASASSEASVAAEQGGATARGVDGIETTERQTAAASSGTASAYAQSVLETLARSRPRTTAGVRGTVRIGFTVARSGEVGVARIISSSGEATLDEAALAAVRSVRFPQPPPSLATAQLSYEIPYIFR